MVCSLTILIYTGHICHYKPSYINDLEKCEYVDTLLQSKWGTIITVRTFSKNTKNMDLVHIQPSTFYKPLKTMKWVKDESQVLGQSLAEQRGKSAGLYP